MSSTVTGAARLTPESLVGGLVRGVVMGRTDRAGRTLVSLGPGLSASLVNSGSEEAQCREGDLVDVRLVNDAEADVAVELVGTVAAKPKSPQHKQKEKGVFDSRTTAERPPPAFSVVEADSFTTLEGKATRSQHEPAMDIAEEIKHDEGDVPMTIEEL